MAKRGKSKHEFTNRTRDSFSRPRLRPEAVTQDRNKILSATFFHNMQVARQRAADAYHRTKWYPSRPEIKKDTLLKKAVRLSVKAESKYRQWQRARTLLMNPWMRIDPRNLIRINPERRLLHCARRAIRRQVLHATKKTGAGKGKQKRPVWNLMSSFSCKR